MLLLHAANIQKKNIQTNLGLLFYVHTHQWQEFLSVEGMKTGRSNVTKGVVVGLLTHDCDRTLFVACFFSPLSLYFVYPFDRFLTSFQMRFAIEAISKYLCGSDLIE
jgi:hypothetical protein